MSRYTKIIGNLEYAWGYDRPLNDFFFEKFDDRKTSEENDMGVVFQIASNYSMTPHSTTPTKHDYSRGKILEIIGNEEEELGVIIIPQEHKDAIATDMPF